MDQTTQGHVGPTTTRIGQVHVALGPLRSHTHVPTRWTWQNWLQHRRRDVPKLVLSRLFGSSVPGLVLAESRLIGRVYRQPSELSSERLQRLRGLLRDNVDITTLAAAFGGHVVDYGTLSTRVVTDAGVGFIVDAFQNLVELENMKFHGFGTGGTAEAAGQTALVTEETTQYSTDNTRPTGSQTENGANVYRTVGTYSPDSGGTRAITEHGLFSQAATGGGTMLDRSLFSVVNLVAGSDSLQVTYDITFTSGG